MRNVPLKGFLKKSPMKQVETVAESTGTPKPREIKIEPPKKQKHKVATITKPKPKTGSVSTGGGLGLLVESGKRVWKGYGTTNPDIIKSGRPLSGKI